MIIFLSIIRCQALQPFRNKFDNSEILTSEDLRECDGMVCSFDGMEPSRGSDFWLQWTHSRSARVQRHREPNHASVLSLFYGPHLKHFSTQNVHCTRFTKSILRRKSFDTRQGNKNVVFIFGIVILHKPQYSTFCLSKFINLG